MRQPEVVLPGKAGSNHIFDELFRICFVGLCPGWHRTQICHFLYCARTFRAVGAPDR
jgi:hypothetical protein